MRRFVVISLILCGWLVFSLQPAVAASDLVEAAQKEGKVVLYSSLPVWANEKLCKAFEEKYGIEAGFYRAGSLKVLQKFLNEKSAGMVKADVFHNLYAAGFETMKKEGHSTAYESPEGAK